MEVPWKALSFRHLAYAFSQVTCPQLLRLKPDVVSPTTSLLCKIDVAHNISIHDSIDSSTKTLALHGQSTLLRDDHDTIESGINSKRQMIVAFLYPPKLNGDRKASGGLVATMQCVTKDGYIMDPCATQASMELISNIVPTLSHEDQMHPLATLSSADIIVAPTFEVPTVHTRGLIVYASVQNPKQKFHLRQDGSDSPKVTMQGIQTTTTNQSSSMMANMAFDLLYNIEWQTYIPGGACHVLLQYVFTYQYVIVLRLSFKGC